MKKINLMLLGLMFVLSFVPVSCGGDSDDDGLNPKESKNKSHKGHEYVDLGLSVKWATCNVGATKPDEYGDYYAWGEIEKKSLYTWDNSRTIDDYDVPANISGNPSYDVACAKWGGDWRLPTWDEYLELIDNCSWKWTTQGGKKGYKVTGKNGNSIFLPAAGQWIDDELKYRNSRAFYWSGTWFDYFASNAKGLYFGADFNITHNIYRCNGCSVRPVLE